MDDYGGPFMDDGMDGGDWDDYEGGPGPMMFIPNRGNARYGNAYGNYRGGYGQGRFYPPAGPPPFPLMGHGFGPAGPPMRKGPMADKAMRYLIRCGVPKGNLKNVPHNLLIRMHPEHCGICNVELESFSVSRMHYTSKNHIKKQRKWVAQGSDGGFLQNREMPLKSRDLYCELCDVQITSKVHADSHYAGKPHRAIVEGRKSTKNPMLLQYGMEGRIEQLIRREKKFLKNLPEEKPEQEQAGENEKIPPELYCEICQTKVTCSEQMTMHLNGKKHLTREKQHILRMMKGESDQGYKNDETYEEENNEAANKEGEEQKQESSEQNCDWGTGDAGERWETEEIKTDNNS